MTNRTFIIVDDSEQRVTVRGYTSASVFHWASRAQPHVPFIIYENGLPIGRLRQSDSGVWEITSGPELQLLPRLKD